MKAIEVPFSYHPHLVDGTEIYVEALSLGLKALDCDVVIAVQGGGAPDCRHDFGRAPYRLAEQAVSHTLMVVRGRRYRFWRREAW